MRGRRIFIMETKADGPWKATGIFGAESFHELRALWERNDVKWALAALADPDYRLRPAKSEEEVEEIYQRIYCNGEE